MAADPSFNLLAFAAVTVPSFLNAGLRVGSLSGLIFAYSSSLDTSISPSYHIPIIYQMTKQ